MEPSWTSVFYKYVRVFICVVAFFMGSVVFPMEVFALTGSYWSLLLILVGLPAAWVFQPKHMKDLGVFFGRLLTELWFVFLEGLKHADLYNRHHTNFGPRNF